jgi:hypothetical protein
MLISLLVVIISLYLSMYVQTSYSVPTIFLLTLNRYIDILHIYRILCDVLIHVHIV